MERPRGRSAMCCTELAYGLAGRRGMCGTELAYGLTGTVGGDQHLDDILHMWCREVPALLVTAQLVNSDAGLQSLTGVG
eukprot:569466-Rhodomonas_salina.1